MNYNKIFQNSEDLSVSVGNSYSEDQMMQTFLDNFHQGVKYSNKIDIHQAELRREEKFTDQKSLSISSLQNGYLNLDSSSGFVRNDEGANTAQTKCTFGGQLITLQKKNFKSIRQEKEKSRAAGDSDNRRTERTPRTFFICGSQDHLIPKFLKPP